MSMDLNAMLLSLIPSGIGFVLFVYGKKQARWPHMVAGILLMAYPYFTDTVLSMIAVGAAIGGALWMALQMGW